MAQRIDWFRTPRGNWFNMNDDESLLSGLWKEQQGGIGWGLFRAKEMGGGLIQRGVADDYCAAGVAVISLRQLIEAMSKFR